MTKKDYEVIAAALKAASDAPGYKERNSFVILELALALAKDNPRFDREEFLTAAGVQS